MRTLEDFKQFYTNELTQTIEELRDEVAQIEANAQEKKPDKIPFILIGVILYIAFQFSWIIGNSLIGLFILYGVTKASFSSSEPEISNTKQQEGFPSTFFELLPDLTLASGFITLVISPIPLIYWFSTGVFLFQAFIWIFLGAFTLLFFNGVPLGIRQEKEANIRKAIKHKLLGKIISFLGDSFQFEPTDSIDKDKINNSLTFPKKAKQLYGEDYVQGKVGNTDIEFSEIIASKSPVKKTATFSHNKRQEKLQQKVNNYISGKKVAENNSHFFRGLYFIADFHKNFQGHTIVRPTNFTWSDVQKSKNSEKKQASFKGSYKPDERLDLPYEHDYQQELKQTTLEDPELESLYNIYTNDPQQARYILSTSTMERIKDFHNRTNDFHDQYKNKVFLAFYQSKMHIAISYAEDLLDPKGAAYEHIMDASSPEELLEKEQLVNLFQDLQFILGIVEDFNLNTRIWSKQ